ncbi:MAG TPA: S41 family peptidase [Stellaceae bacterium]|nr:S41 family peptidase [Stellaceae bacterium]
MALAGCVAAQPVAEDGETSRLFTRGYQEVMDYYIAPVTAREAALAALSRLPALASGLAVVARGGDVVLAEAGTPLAHYAAPADRDAPGWGALTAAVLRDARAHSRDLAATSRERIEQGLFAGLTASLDRFSVYWAPDTAHEMRAAREGFDGIGITIDTRAEPARVSSLVPDGPAERAGLAVDDRILAIDGAPAAAMAREEIVRRLRGPADSRVELTVARSGVAEALKLTITRAYVVVPTVTARRDGALAVFRISGFNQHTADSLRQAFVKLRREMRDGLRGIVLDLRDNPGGLLDQGVAVADLFMTGGRIVATVGRSPGSNQEFDASPGDLALGLPIAVIVNGGSASSAEIVAAALQDSGRAVVVGTSSYGKGTVQTVLSLPNEGELWLTWARLVTPGGYLLQEHGVVPAVCTLGAETEALPAILRRSAAGEPRAGLDEAGWSRLRRGCPGETAEHKVDLEAAERVVSDRALYARLIPAEPTALAAKPSPGPQQ